MRRTDVVIIGAGQAGLAMSRELAARGIAHVVLERGQVAERWRASGWDSLRLVTPNWMTRLPDWRYRGPDPDGFMPRAAFVRFLSAYAGAIAAPVIGNSPVIRLTGTAGDFTVETPADQWHGRAVVIATGHCEAPAFPAASAPVHQLHSSEYRNPGSLPPGNILVVGASASGSQIAEELATAGRSVTLSVGRHVSVPRCVFGHDIYWWFDRLGLLEEPADPTRHPAGARDHISLQLVGRIGGPDLDLAALQAVGVRLAGRVGAVDGTRVDFVDSLEACVRHAEAKRARLLARIAARARDMGWASADAAAGSAPLRLVPPPASLDLHRAGISTIVCATGFRRDLDWVHLPVVDGAGELVHREGVLPVAGLYTLGMRMMRRRNSHLIDGVGADAAHIAGHVKRQLGHRSQAA